MRHATLLVSLALLPACANHSLSSEEEAEMVYLGLDTAIDKAMNLGFDGYNAADSANIPEQRTTGDVSGSLIVTGQVDQGVSDNKNMRLDLSMDEYSDFVDLDADDKREISVAFWTDTDAGLPYFDLQLRDIPDGTFDGTLTGSFSMEGDVEGEASILVNIDGDIESNDLGGIRRVTGSTTIVGTATGPSGAAYDIDVSI